MLLLYPSEILMVGLLVNMVLSMTMSTKTDCALFKIPSDCAVQVQKRFNRYKEVSVEIDGQLARSSIILTSPPSLVCPGGIGRRHIANVLVGQLSQMGYVLLTSINPESCS